MRLGLQTRLTVAVASLVLIGLVVVGLVLTRDAAQTLGALSKERVQAAVAQNSLFLNYVFDAVERDLLQLLAARELRDFARGAPLDRVRMHEQLQALLLKQDWYKQVRFIGRADAGRELLRVDRAAGEAQVILPAALQQKAGRDYFKEAIDLPRGAVYFSRINLNREFGQIEQPPWPTLRVASPLYGAAGESVGILIINFDVQRVFERLQSSASKASVFYLANRDGDFLVHPQPGKAFAFEYGTTEGLFEEFPMLNAQRQRLVAGSGNQVFAAFEVDEIVAAFQRVGLPGVGPERELYLGVSESNDWVTKEVALITRRSFFLVAGLSVLGVVLVGLAVRRVTSPLREITEAVDGFSGVAGLPELPVQQNDEVGVLARAYAQMAARIQTQLRSIQTEHARLDALIETMADPVILIGPDGRIEQCNSAATRLFGYANEELVGRNVSILMNPHDASQHDDYLARYMQTGEGKILGIGREVEGRHKDGRPLPLYLSVGEFDVEGRQHFTGILHDLSERLAMERQLRELAYTDPLTEAYNRRYFIEQLVREAKAQERQQTGPALLMFDLDLFKEINDRFGHEAGDLVLQCVTELARQSVREVDMIARLGGDEFAILMPQTNIEQAQLVAQRLCAAALDARVEGYAGIRIGLSVGVAAHQSGEAVEEWMRRVDTALYQAKQRGRGQVALAVDWLRDRDC